MWSAKTFDHSNVGRVDSMWAEAEQRLLTDTGKLIDFRVPLTAALSLDRMWSCEFVVRDEFSQ